jgi:hypothetical protein
MSAGLDSIVRRVLLEGENPDSIEADPAQKHMYQTVLDRIAEDKSGLSLISQSVGEQALFVAVAICIARNETKIGTSDTYMLGTGRGSMPVFDIYKSRDVETLASYVGQKSGIASVEIDDQGNRWMDPSVGVTQLKFSNIATPEMMQMRSALGIEEPEDLQNPAKAVIATAVYLHVLYQKAISLGYSTGKPGFSKSSRVPEGWKSTDNAALDLAIAAYNSNPKKVLRNFCGDPEGTGKMTPCEELDSPDNIIPNYIPYYEGSELRSDGGKQDQPIGTLRYITSVAKSLPAVFAKVRAAIG